MDENTDDAFALPFINRYAQDYDIIIVSISIPCNEGNVRYRYIS